MIPYNYFVLDQLRSMRLQMRSIPYRLGNKVECPICGSKYKAFMPFRYRVNAYCPSCKSLERHRLAYIALKEKLGFYEAVPKKVLHFAPDICLYESIRSSRYIDYSTADNMTTFTSSITVRPAYVMSIDDIKFENATFDVVIAIGVLVMVVDNSKALQEIQRVLKPGGYVVLHDPIDYSRAHSFSDKDISAEERQTLYHGHDQRWYYGQDYADRIRAEGLEVEEITAQNIDYERYGVSPNEKIYIATKKK
ncbi:class I SAM-dependent methyltransferase [Runella zeae]|uniref:class I SAM-dependent methyltransferase n=1 Tax=Runella zeae TaxID=94255 RepID=UPI0004231E20|nr:class I SAM-dependent methyltransferase [Runella zeae]